jgi:hypothetical protein
MTRRSGMFAKTLLFGRWVDYMSYLTATIDDAVCDGCKFEHKTRVLGCGREDVELSKL